LSRRAYADLQTILNQTPKPKIATPTIYVQGGADACDLPACSADQAEYFTGPYERVVVKGVGHFPHREEPKTIARLLIRQLAER
jgi:pimeloyl-ACP methyl ester carboxylesterase